MKWAIGCAAVTIVIISLAINVPDAACSSLTGIVTDPSGAAIQGTNVIITNTDTGASVRTVTIGAADTAGIYHAHDRTITNAAGIYYADELSGGRYSVSVEAERFVKTIKNNIYVPTELQRRVDFVVKRADGKTDAVEIDLQKEELNRSESVVLPEGEKQTIVLIGKIESIVPGVVTVMVEDARKFKINNICSLIIGGSPGSRVGGNFDFCTRLKDFNQFHIGDTVTITHVRDPQLIELVTIEKRDDGHKEIMEPTKAK
jgi:hypothetical protein